MATSGIVNCLDTVGNIFAITGVQLEVGPNATSFEHRHYGTELALCQRYYERVITTNNSGPIFPAYVSGTTNIDANIMWKVTKRAIPVVTGSSGTGYMTGIIGSTSFTTSGFNSAFQMSEYGSRFTAISTTSFTNGQAGSLLFANANTWVSGDAEL